MDVGITQGLRRLVRAGELSSARAAEAIADLADLDLHRHAHLDLLMRAWKLRETITAYDGMYVALAEALDALIVTCDQPLSKASRTPCQDRTDRLRIGESESSAQLKRTEIAAPSVSRGYMKVTSGPVGSAEGSWFVHSHSSRGSRGDLRSSADISEQAARAGFRDPRNFDSCAHCAHT